MSSGDAEMDSGKTPQSFGVLLAALHQDEKHSAEVLGAVSSWEGDETFVGELIAALQQRRVASYPRLLLLKVLQRVWRQEDAVAGVCVLRKVVETTCDHLDKLHVLQLKVVGRIVREKAWGEAYYTSVLEGRSQVHLPKHLLVVQHCHGADWLPNAVLVGLYMKWIIGSGVGVADVLLRSYRRVYRAMVEESTAAQVAADMQRAMKRTPERFFPALKVLVEMEPTAVELVRGLLPQMIPLLVTVKPGLRRTLKAVIARVVSGVDESMRGQIWEEWMGKVEGQVDMEKKGQLLLEMVNNIEACGGEEKLGTVSGLVKMLNRKVPQDVLVAIGKCIVFSLHGEGDIEASVQRFFAELPKHSNEEVQKVCLHVGAPYMDRVGVREAWVVYAKELATGAMKIAKKREWMIPALEILICAGEPVEEYMEGGLPMFQASFVTKYSDAVAMRAVDTMLHVMSKVVHEGVVEAVVDGISGVLLRPDLPVFEYACGQWCQGQEEVPMKYREAVLLAMEREVMEGKQRAIDGKKLVHVLTVMSGGVDEGVGGSALTLLLHSDIFYGQSKRRHQKAYERIQRVVKQGGWDERQLCEAFCERYMQDEKLRVAEMEVTITRSVVSLTKLAGHVMKEALGSRMAQYMRGLLEVVMGGGEVQKRIYEAGRGELWMDPDKGEHENSLTEQEAIRDAISEAVSGLDVMYRMISALSKWNAMFSASLIPEWMLVVMEGMGSYEQQWKQASVRVMIDLVHSVEELAPQWDTIVSALRYVAGKRREIAHPEHNIEGMVSLGNLYEGIEKDGLLAVEEVFLGLAQRGVEKRGMSTAAMVMLIPLLEVLVYTKVEVKEVEGQVVDAEAESKAFWGFRVDAKMAGMEILCRQALGMALTGEDARRYGYMLVYVLGDGEMSSIKDRVVGALEHYMEGTDDMEAILEGLLSEDVMLRQGCMQGISVSDLEGMSREGRDWQRLQVMLYYMTYEPDVEVKRMADKVYERVGGMEEEGPYGLLVELLGRQSKNMQRQVSEAIGGRVGGSGGGYARYMEMLREQYTLHKIPEKLVRGRQEGMTAEEVREIRKLEIQCERGVWNAAVRMGTAYALKEIVEVYETIAEEQVLEVVNMLCGEILGDMEEEVREVGLACGLEMMGCLQGKYGGLLVDKMRAWLGEDGRREAEKSGIAVLLARLATFMPDLSEEMKEETLQTLKGVLFSASEGVQASVSKCMGGLLGQMDERHRDAYAREMMEKMRKGRTQKDRVGGGYGLAGLVSGGGVRAIRKYKIGEMVKEMGSREEKGGTGMMKFIYALSGMEMKAVEPVVVLGVLTTLHKMGQHGETGRQEALDMVVKVIGTVSVFGVSMILRRILKLLGAREVSWKVKEGAVILLRSLRACSSRQLSLSLPDIVPLLAEIVLEGHPKVVSAAKQTLREIGKVISSEAMKKALPSIYEAIFRPEQRIEACLDVLMGIRFTHALDAASVSLMMPTILRGLQERMMRVKKRATQIVGAIGLLVSRAILKPYVEDLVPRIRSLLFDADPELRTIASKAMGSVVGALGKGYAREMIPDLVKQFREGGGTVQRTGAAQGLSEILSSIGEEEAVEGVMYQAERLVQSARPEEREGAMAILCYVPRSLRERYAGHVERALWIVMEAGGDESEMVRSMSKKAMHAIVEEYHETHRDVFEAANAVYVRRIEWRKRLTAVQLVEEVFSHYVRKDSRTYEKILEMPVEEAEAMLSELFMLTLDSTHQVKSSARETWKGIVENTGLILKQILGGLVSRIVEGLSQEEENRVRMSGRALGELATRLGEGVVEKVIPSLQAGMRSEEVAIRRGVCIGMNELVRSAISGGVVEKVSSTMVGYMVDVLEDEDESVQEAAVNAWEGMYYKQAKLAVEAVVPQILVDMQEGAKTMRALAAMKRILSRQSETILPMVMPLLVQPPFDEQKAIAVRSIASVVGEYLHEHIGSLLGALYATRSEHALEAGVQVMRHIQEDYQYMLVEQLIQFIRRREGGTAEQTLEMIRRYFESKGGFGREEMERLMQEVMQLGGEEEKMELVEGAYLAMLGYIGGDLEAYVGVIRQGMETMMDEEIYMMSRGTVGKVMMQKMVPLVKGGKEKLEAIRLSTLVMEKSDMKAIQPFVLMFSGALIRISGERQMGEVRMAIGQGLRKILVHGGTVVRGFYPQMQTVIVRLLRDEEGRVRREGLDALEALVEHHTRVDTILRELVQGEGEMGSDKRETILRGIQIVLGKGGVGVEGEMYERVMKLGEAGMKDDQYKVREVSAEVIGQVESAQGEVGEGVMKKWEGIVEGWKEQQSVLMLKGVIVGRGEVESGVEASVREEVNAQVVDGKSQVKVGGMKAVEYMLERREGGEGRVKYWYGQWKVWDGLGGGGGGGLKLAKYTLLLKIVEKMRECGLVTPGVREEVNGIAERVGNSAQQNAAFKQLIYLIRRECERNE